MSAIQLNLGGKIIKLNKNLNNHINHSYYG
jgi:hypothetical protein